MHDDGLGFDADTCDDCGLCVAVCPTGALARPAPPLARSVDARGQRSLNLACEHGADAGPGRVACLYGLPTGWLLRQCRAERAQVITVAIGPCASCERGGAAAGWRAEWQALHERLRLNGQPAPALLPLAPAEWQARVRPADAPDPARRRFFGRIVRPPATAEATASGPMSSERDATVTHLHPPSASGPRAAPLWSVTLDATRCSACLACTHLCPSGALAFQPAQADGQPEHLALDLHRCTGCGLCQAVCDSAALSAPFTPPPDAPEPAAWRLPLERQRCSRCGHDFHRTRIAQRAAEAPLCCPVCAAGRPAQPARWVEAADAP